MLKSGYQRKSIPAESTRVKFNIECWAFKGYYNYILSDVVGEEDKTFLTLSTEYRGKYSFARTFGKILSFIMDGQHDHAAEIAKQYAAHIVKKREEASYVKGETGQNLEEGEFEILDEGDL